MRVRRLGREMALGALYQVDVIGEHLPVALEHARELLLSREAEDRSEDAPGDLSHPLPPDLADRLDDASRFATDLATTTLDNIGELDEIISRYAEGWTLSRMATVDRNILRLALTEMVHFPDIPVSVSIDEAVAMAKEYSTDDSGKFVNGILGAYAREGGLVEAQE
ncbi:MAG: transcription antitermination factor NusB [Armatimonadota bacterium]